MAAERGSDKLYAGSLKSRPFKEQELRQAVEIFSKIGDLDDYFPLGKPDPEVIFASIRVRPENLAVLIRELMAVDGLNLRHLDSFPKGLPRPEEFIVRLQLAGQLEQ